MSHLFRPSRLAAGLLLFVLSVIARTILTAQAMADSSLPGSWQNGTTIYLPIATAPTIPEAPTLVAPANGDSLNTLIPTFAWKVALHAEVAQGGSCLTFDTNPDALDGCWASGWVGASGILEEIAWFNFEPDTLYYWRVGHVYDYDYDNIYWSETRSFRTGQAGGAIPAAPILYGPLDGSSTPQNNLFLEWNSVLGALKYSVSVHRPDGSGYGWSEIPDTYLDLRSNSYSDVFSPGGPYEWSVAARNDYAWGQDSNVWTFSISETRAVAATAANMPVVTLRMPDGSIRQAVTR